MIPRPDRTGDSAAVAGMRGTCGTKATDVGVWREVSEGWTESWPNIMIRQPAQQPRTACKVFMEVLI